MLVHDVVEAPPVCLLTPGIGVRRLVTGLARVVAEHRHVRHRRGLRLAGLPARDPVTTEEILNAVGRGHLPVLAVVVSVARARVADPFDPRAVVVASTDTLLRSADAADLLTVGIASGICFATRLHRAGAKVAYAELGELADSLRNGAKDLIQAGVPPLPLG